MNRLITKLSSELAKELSMADEIFIAVALLNDQGLDFLLQDLKDNCKIKLIVGIDLPTTPKALRKLKELERVDVRLYSRDNYFHPKLYALKTGDEIKIFVGSSNFTNGGLNDNIELSLFSSDKDACNDVLKWFNDVFSSSKLLSDEFLQEYEQIFPEVEKQRNADKKRSLKLKGLLASPEPENPLTLLTNEFYFVKSDYEILSSNNSISNTPQVLRERGKVKAKLEKLEEYCYNEVSKKGWKLYRNRKFNRTSGINLNTTNAKKINSIWLHLGKDNKEMSMPGRLKESFIENIRMQVIISGNLRLSGFGPGVGVWLMVGKQKGSLEDRGYIKKMITKESFKKELYQKVENLGSGYYIQINGESIPCDKFDINTLCDFIEKDNPINYFIIGKDFKPNDYKLMLENINKTIMYEFELLYPIYELLKYK